MKKLLFSLIFIFSFILGYTQDTKDSASVMYFRNANTIYREVSAFPSGQVADSIDFFETGGVKFQRLDSRSTIYDLQALRIYANGSNMRVLLQRILNNSRITGIKIDQFGGGIVDASGGTIDFNGKKLISYGGTILKIDSVANFTIYAPYDVQIFDSTTRVGNMLSSTGVVSPMWWGAIGDNSHNDRRMLQRAFDVPNAMIKFPTGYTFRWDSTITLNKTSSADMEGANGVYTGSGWAVKIGTDVFTSGDVATSSEKYYFFNIKKSSQSNWADSFDINGSTGVMAVNINASRLYPNKIEGFTNAVVLYGNTYGDVHNKIFPGRLLNNKIALWSTGSGSGWSNSNRIYGGTISINTGVNTGLARYGWVVGSPTDTYTHNNNIWYGGIFEGGGNAYVGRFFNSISNWMFGFRDEDTNPIVAVFEGSAQRNILRSGYSVAGTKKIDSSAGGTNLYFDTRDQTREGADAYTIAKWTAANNGAAYDSLNVGVIGIGLYNGSGTAVTNVLQSQLAIYPNFVEIKGSSASLGFEVETDITKELLIKQTFVDGRTARLIITLYDSLNNILTETTLRPQMDNSTPIWSSSYGTGWITGTNSDQDFYLSVKDEVKKVKARVVRGTAVNVRLKDFMIEAIAPTENVAKSSVGSGIYGKYNVATRAPQSMGTYNLGHIVYRAIPNKDSADYWRCSVAGTARQLVSGSGAITSGTNKLLVSGVSVDSIYRGEYILVNSVTYRIEGKRGDTLYLSANAGSTFSGSINYSQPVWVKSGVDVSSLTIPQINVQNLSDSFQTHRIRLDSLEKNDTIPFNLYRKDNNHGDSLYADIGDQTIAVFAPISGGKIKIVNNIDYTLEPDVYSVVISNSTATRTITLPEASDYPNRTVIFRYAGNASYTMAFTETIRTNSTTTITSIADGESIIIHSDGTEWWLIMKH